MRQKNWKGHFVQLNTRPEGCPIDPKVLSETAVVALRCSQIDERSERCFHIAGRQQTAGALNEIPRPHEMIAPNQSITLGATILRIRELILWRGRVTSAPDYATTRFGNAGFLR
jgi:hypothetical protein